MNIVKALFVSFLLSSSSTLSAQVKAPELPDMGDIRTELKNSAPPADAAGKTVADPASTPTESNYDRVKALFEKGVKPATTDLLGYHFGRCFISPNASAAPGEITGFTLYAEKRDSAGPIDPDYPEVAGNWQRIDWSNAKMNEYQKYWFKSDFSGPSLRTAVAASDHIEVKSTDLGFQMFAVAEVRKNGPYLAVHVKDTTDYYCYTYFMSPVFPLAR